jgi:lysophospholipase L1-like esterase
MVIFSLLPVFFLLILGEASVRTWSHYYRTTYERYNPAIGRLELVPNVRIRERREGEILINSKGFVGKEFEVQKEPGTYRIVAVGDSCTFGGSWNTAYPYYLDQLLATEQRGAKFEVINAGIEGYNSTYALSRIKEEILPLNPDLVTIYIGWNDLMKVNPENLSESGRYTWLAMLIDKSYLMKGIHKVLFHDLRPMIMQPKLGGDVQDLHAFDQFVPTVYEENLEKMIAALREKGVQAILLTRPTVAMLDMKQEDIARHNIFFPYFAGSYSLGKLLSLHRAYNRSVMRIAKKYDVPLVDLDKMFDRYDKRPLFWDTMHPSEKGQQLIAGFLAEEISKHAASIID